MYFLYDTHKKQFFVGCKKDYIFGIAKYTFTEVYPNDTNLTIALFFDKDEADKMAIEIIRHSRNFQPFMENVVALPIGSLYEIFNLEVK